MEIMNCTKKKLLFYGGLMIWVFLFLWSLINKDDLMVYYLDQLDGEMTYYMLRAKNFPNLFVTSYKEFMNGSAMVEVASLLGILPYVFFTPKVAFIVNEFAVRILAYVGMFKMLDKLDVEPFICFLVAALFPYLPLYSVYGLSVMGIPLLVYAFINLYNSHKLLVSYSLIVIFALSSSLVLSGYFLCGFLVVHIICMLIKKDRPVQKHFILGTFLLIALYALENYELILSILLGIGTVSHKIEYDVTQMNPSLDSM